MKNNTFYFPHDYNARLDKKMKHLVRKHGMTGYGIIWAIFEDLYNNANALQTDYESIAFDLRTEPERIKDIVENFDFFEIRENIFSSESVKRRLLEREEKSTKAAASASSRWSKDASALRSQSEGNAIKESKLNIKKIKNKKNPDAPLEGASDFFPEQKPSSEKNIRQILQEEYPAAFTYYENQLQSNKNVRFCKEYKQFVNYLFAGNCLDAPAKPILEMEKQLSFADFLYLREAAKEQGKSLADTVDVLLNDTKYTRGKISVFMTLKNFIER